MSRYWQYVGERSESGTFGSERKTFILKWSMARKNLVGRTPDLKETYYWGQWSMATKFTQEEPLTQEENITGVKVCVGVGRVQLEVQLLRNVVDCMVTIFDEGNP